MRPVRILSLRALLLVVPMVVAAIGAMVLQGVEAQRRTDEAARLAGVAAQSQMLADTQAVLTVKTDQLLALGGFGKPVPPALETRRQSAEAMASSMDTGALLTALRVSDQRAAMLRESLVEAGVGLPASVDGALQAMDGNTESALEAGNATFKAKAYAEAIDWLGEASIEARARGREAQQALVAVSVTSGQFWKSSDFLLLVLVILGFGVACIVFLRRAIGQDIQGTLVERDLLTRKNVQLERLLTVVRRLTSTLDIGEIAKTTVEEAASSADGQFALLALAEGHELVPTAVIGPVPGARVAAYHGLCGRVIDAGQPLRAIVPGEPALGQIEGPLSLVAAPIVSGGHVIGVLIAGRAGEWAMGDDAEMALQHLALCAGPAIETARQHGTTAKLALIDALTGLHNKRRLDQDLTNVVARCAREHRPVSFMMIDVDHFKRYNDTYGHPAGDAVLRRVAGIVRSCVREHDTVYRFGGEEIAVLLPSTHMSDALAVAERVRATVAIDAEPGNDPARRVTVSVGLACTVTHDAIELLQQADLALYEAKRAGRNRVVSTAMPGSEGEVQAEGPDWFPSHW